MSTISSNRSEPPQSLADVYIGSKQMELGKVFPVIPGRLSFTIHRDEEHTKACIKHDRTPYYFSSWMHESYESFVSDFGPVNLSATVQFCKMLQEKLNNPRLQRRHLVYYCDADAAFFTNLAYLLGAYLVLVEDWSPDAAAKQFENIDSSMLRPFHDVLHDATKSLSTFDLTLLDCFRGLQRAVNDGFFKYSDFDVEQYELMLDPSVADASVICPQFLAVRGPMSSSYCASGKAVSFRWRTEWAKEPSEYVELFKELGVSSVVRLNGAETYDKEEFRKHRLEHHELFFEDCSVPSHQLVQDFHAICDAASGRIAVHCMAGLGRTGTMIATWIMRRFGWTAREVIAWLRIVRPGSVMGQQQHFLECYEHSLRVQQDAAAVVSKSSNHQNFQHFGFLKSLLPRASAMAYDFSLQASATTGHDSVGPLPAILGGAEHSHKPSKHSEQSERAAPPIAKEMETICHEQEEQSNEPPKSRPVSNQTSSKSRRQSKHEEELLKPVKDTQKEGHVPVTTDKDRCKHEENMHLQERDEMKKLFEMVRAGQAAGNIQMLRRRSTENILLPGGVYMKFCGAAK